ncbi:MAG: hypothetical protein HC779_07260 [Phyllobacteriaceae bacterium]|nr:hypothetical protein [Phyllobacteriaceae bacterium]
MTRPLPSLGEIAAAHGRLYTSGAPLLLAIVLPAIQFRSWRCSHFWAAI